MLIYVTSRRAPNKQASPSVAVALVDHFSIHVFVLSFPTSIRRRTGPFKSDPEVAGSIESYLNDLHSSFRSLRSQMGRHSTTRVLHGSNHFSQDAAQLQQPAVGIRSIVASLAACTDETDPPSIVPAMTALHSHRGSTIFQGKSLTNLSKLSFIQTARFSRRSFR